jgi:hypothetical protein
MISASGKALDGLNTAAYSEPDQRPLVTAAYAKVNNVDGVLEASSSKPGTIYLVKYTGNYNYLDDYQTLSELEQAVTDNLGRKADAPVENAMLSFSAHGLPGGFYMFYAVDREGRISLPSDAWPEVMATGPVLGLGNERKDAGFSVWSSSGTIYIQPTDHTTGYTVQVFDTTGRLLTGRANIAGDQQLTLQAEHGIVIVRLIAENGLKIETCKCFYGSF